MRYPGDYDAYRVQREARLKRSLEEYVRQNEKIEKTEDFIRRNIAGQNTKQAQARRKMLEKLERVDRPDDIWEAARHLGITFEAGDHPGGKEMIRARGLSIGYEGKPPLFEGFDATIYRGERIGIVGPNGAGKTSFVRALLGKLRPRAGSIELGFNVALGYLDQKLDGLAAERSLVDEVRLVRPDLKIEEARGALGRFRFFGDDSFKMVAALSGGERCRLALLKLSLEPHNLLVLDEPTNHLDIPAREVLERALGAYEGTLLVISHDRAFLDAVATKIFWFDGASVRIFEGNYSEARRKLTAEATAKAAAIVEEPREKAPRPESAEREEKKRREREQRKSGARIKVLEEEIATLEARSKELQQALAKDPGGDWEKLHKLANEEQEVRARIERRVREWERLSSAST